MPVIQINTLPEGHTPTGALWRAAVLPGWGQFYNKQYWKIPIVWAGLGALGYSVVYNWKNYWLYKRAHRWKISQERVQDGTLEENPFPKDEDEYLRLKAQNGGPIPSSTLRSRRKAYRRNLELSIIGGLLFYGLTLADAYISAHLLSFEVREDVSLALDVSPHLGRPRAALRLHF